jgi:hypothetical protein
VAARALVRSGASLALDVELVRGSGVGRRGRAEGASGEEEREDRVLLGVRVRSGVFVEVSGGGEDVVGFLVGLGESLLSLEETDVDGNNGRVILSGVVDVLKERKEEWRQGT